MLKFCVCALYPPRPICFLQASSIFFPFSLVKIYHSKPSLCFAFACNPYSACYYNTLHLTIQWWGFLLLWEGLPVLMLVVDIYCSVPLLPHIVVLQHSLVKLFRCIYTVSPPQNALVAAVPEHKTLKRFSHL